MAAREETPSKIIPALNGLTLAEGLELLYAAGIMNNLYQGLQPSQFPLQLRILLSIPEVTARLEEELRLPITGNWQSLIINYRETFYYIGCEEISTPYRCFLKAIASGMIDAVNKYISDVGGIRFPEEPVIIAAEHNQVAILEILLPLDPVLASEDRYFYDQATLSALLGRNFDLAIRILRIIYKSNPIIFGDYFWTALAKKFDRTEFQHILSLISPWVYLGIDDPRYENILRRIVMNGAAWGGHLELLKSQITSEVKPSEITLVRALVNQSSEVITEVLKYLPLDAQQKFPLNSFALSPILSAVAEHGNLSDIDWWIQHLYEPPIESILWGAAIGGQIEVYRRFYTPPHSIEDDINIAATLGKSEMVQYLLTLDSNINILNAGLRGAVDWYPDNKHEKRSLIKFLIDLGADDLITARQSLVAGDDLDPELIAYFDEMIPPLDEMIPPLDEMIPPLDEMIPPLDEMIPPLEDLIL